MNSFGLGAGFRSKLRPMQRETLAVSVPSRHNAIDVRPRSGVARTFKQIENAVHAVQVLGR
jgi:hypothetical protein